MVQIGSYVGGLARDIGRTDRLVGFLRVFCRAAIDARRIRDVVRAELGADQCACGGDCLGRNGDPIGAHIGDQSNGVAAELDAFVKPLRNLHRARGAKAKLARCFLLQCGGRKRRKRIAPDLPAVDLGNRKSSRTQDRVGCGTRFGLAVEFEAIKPFTVEMGQSRGEILSALGREGDFDGPIFARLESLDLGFALADQSQCDRLHAAGRAATGQFAPQHRRQGETDQIIERPARQISFDQFAVYFARPPEGVDDGITGDFIEHHPLDVDILQCAARFQHFLDMPGDRLAFAVRVGRKEQAIGAPHRLDNRFHVLFGFAVDLPGHREVRIRLDGTVLCRQIAHMAVARDDFVVVTEIFIDGFRFCRQFDDDDFHQPFRSEAIRQDKRGLCTSYRRDRR